MKKASTLREIAGLKDSQIDWKDAVLILIDFQNEYISGSLPLGSKRENAINNAKKYWKRLETVVHQFFMCSTLPVKHRQFLIQSTMHPRLFLY